MSSATGATAGGPTRSDLLALGRRRFLAGRRLDMQAMATELGVSRTTVYRWAGNHDQLLGEVLSGLTYATFRASEQSVRQHGRARVLAVYTNFVTYVAGSAAVAAALRRDPHQFFRVATKSGPVHRAAAVLTEELMRREVERGALELVADVRDIAAAMVRVTETGLYADMLAGLDPDIARLREIVSLLLVSPR
jgi:AcrR family transcriptional regulator